MKTVSSVLDASALLAHLKREDGFQLVKSALEEAADGKTKLFINEMNLGEVYYVLAREHSEGAARYFHYERLPLLPLSIFSNSLDTVIAAAQLKASTGLHYVDCFAAVTTMETGSELLTCDRDFEKVKDEIRVRLLR